MSPILINYLKKAEARRLRIDKQYAKARETAE